MRALKVLALVLVPLAGLAVCGQTRADAAPATVGVAGPAHYISPAGNQRFLTDYATRPDVKKLPDGLMYRVLRAAPSDGPQVPKNREMVEVYYKGTLINGKVFDKTKPEEPAALQVGGVIPGWTEALKLMKTGATWELVIPADLAYGREGKGGIIP